MSERVPKHIRLLEEIGLEGIDAFFGDPKRKRRYFVSEVTYHMGMQARLAMVKSCRGESLTGNERYLLEVFYPNGPRYVQPYAGDKC